MTSIEKMALQARSLATKAKDIHELQHPIDVYELRSRFDDLARITESLAVCVEQIANECWRIRTGEP